MRYDLVDQLSRSFFRWIHQNHLIYNACWEDPRLDRLAMGLTSADNLLMITSAGCNALDYALDRPHHIYAIDMNPRQNALLDLKIAGIRALDFDDFFKIFGTGYHAHFARLYKEKLRKHLPPNSQKIWDSQQGFFQKDSFYFQGTSGLFARGIYQYINLRKLRGLILEMFDTDSMESQAEMYYKFMKPKFWSSALQFLLGTDAVLSLLGVPRSQRKHLESTYPGGMVRFMENSLESVMTKLPLKDNYFWWLYFNGRYSPQRCPGYLEESKFAQLKAGDVDRISTHTATVTDFLVNHEVSLSRFVLLDHMDWLAAYDEKALADEWRMIFLRSTSEARYLWRSASTDAEFISRVEINQGDGFERVGEKIQYHRQSAKELHARDRVHTYGSFAIAERTA